MFASLTRAYYKGAAAVFYVFSVADRESFDAIESWRGKVEAECGPNIISILVQNKIDLMDENSVQIEEGEALAKKLGMPLIRASVKENIGVNEAFEYITETFLRLGGMNSGSKFSNLESMPRIGELSGAKSELSAEEKAKLSMPANSKGNDPNLTQSSGDNSENDEDALANPHQTNTTKSSAPFQLKPLTRRTNGKKRFRICSIV